MKPSVKNSLMIFLTLLALIFSSLGVTPALAAGVDLSNNLSQPVSTITAATVNSINWKAQGFTTDAAHTQITSVTLPLCRDSGVTGSYEVQIWTATGAGATPGSRVADVAATDPTSALSTFVVGVPCPNVTFSGLAIDLFPSTTYYLLVSGVGMTGTGYVRWDYTNSTSGAGFPSTYTYTLNGGASWSSGSLSVPKKMQIVADVPAAATVTVLTSSPKPSTVGQSVTFTATIAPAPSGGTVAFNDNGTTITGCGTQAVNGSGQATCITSALTVGTHPITAVYGGNGSYAGSTSSVVNQVVNCSSAITVANNADSGAGSLRQAMADVCTGGTIDFDNNYTITLSSELTISKDLTIDGMGHSVTISGDTISGGSGEVPVFHVNSGITFNLNTITVEFWGGDPDSVVGGCIDNHGTVIVTHSNFTKSILAIVNDTGATATVSDSAFTSNFEAINNPTDATLTVTNSSFVQNRFGPKLNGSGGIYNQGTLTVINSTFSESQSNKGSAIANDTGGTATLTGNTFTNNTGQAMGGAIANYRGSMTVTRNTFTGNSQTYGTEGGYYGGGAIWNFLGDLTVTDSVFSGNSSGTKTATGTHYPGLGGAIASLGTLTVTGSTFDDNSSWGHGGAIATEIWGSMVPVDSFSMSLTNNTFRGNHAESYDSISSKGGAVYIYPIYNPLTLNLTNNTFAANTASSGDNLNFDQQTTAALTVNAYNNIVQGASGGNCVRSGTMTINASNNLADDGTCGTGFTNSPSILLGTLGNYGGTTETFPLLPGSAAIDAGNAATCAAAPVNSLDQRGVTRPTACDIGAFESQGFTLTQSNGDGQSVPINTPFTNPLEVTVTSKASSPSEPVDGGQVTFTPNGTTANASITTSPATIASGAASITATANATVGGPYNVIASTAGATSVNFALTNNQAATTTTLTSDVNPSAFGASVTFTAKPSADTGTVTFQDNGVNITGCVAVALSSGKATCILSTLTVGMHPITAVYSGDTNYSGNTSNRVEQVVDAELSINDVTLNEGNSGTTTFSFTVSLSAPAPIGGVTFDITTADNTATTANNDYTAKAVTGATIPAGQSTYTFDVFVNGDTSIETNEVFNVNVTNVTNANLTDGLGKGTLTNDDSLSVVMSSISTDTTSVSPIPVTVTFSDIATGFIATDITVVNGSVSNFSGSGALYTFDLIPASAGLVTADIATGVALDPQNNGNTAATQFKRTYDNAAPTVSTTSLSLTYAAGGLSSFTVTFSENVNNPTGDTDKEDVTNPANYFLVNKGANGVVDTVSCKLGLAGDDTQVAVSNVIYIPNTAVVTLAASLPAGNYRLFLCGTTSIVDLGLNPLNGGTDSTFDITVSATATGGDDGNKDKTNARIIPSTGFAPNVTTILPPQPAELRYTQMSNLWIEIPSQNIKSNIVGVPQSEDAWNVKWLGKDAGWLNGTAFPSWTGNSVITAHVTDSNGLPGPFANLKDLKYGDQVIIHLSDKQYIFEIRNTLQVRPETTDYAFEHLKDGSYLTLITCQSYDPSTNSYRLRRVVRAVLMEVK